jgi:hypothetical protein
MKTAAANVRAFVRRDRRRVAVAKRAYWGNVARGTPNVTIALAHALYEHAKAVSPGFPSDFAHHLRLKGLIDRAARSLSVRRGSR